MDADAVDATWAPQSPDLSSYHAHGSESAHPQHHAYRGSISHGIPPFEPLTSSPLPSKSTPPAFASPSYTPRGLLHHESMQHADYIPEPEERSRGKRKEGNGGGGSSLPPGAENVNITVHFPVARIKRIMQADDDVGKVAQVTPVVVSKALELFMISLVTKAAAEAKAKNSKRVGAIHLKQAITKDEQFDFLNEIVAKVADAPPADKSEGDAMEVDGKKRKASSRKKKKTDDDDF